MTVCGERGNAGLNKTETPPFSPPQFLFLLTKNSEKPCSSMGEGAQGMRASRRLFLHSLLLRLHRCQELFLLRGRERHLLMHIPFGKINAHGNLRFPFARCINTQIKFSLSECLFHL